MVEKQIIQTKRLKQKNWAFVGIACLLMLLCILPSPKTEECDIVFFGDSVIGNRTVYELPFINEYVSEKLGKRVLNGAFGGTAMADMERESDALCIDAWSMVNLTEAICLDNWGAVRAMMSYADSYKETGRQAFDGYKERLDMLAKVDFDEVEVILIEHGSNDFFSGTALDNPDNPLDERTFGGALRTTLEWFGKYYPDITIVIMTPMYCEIQDKDNASFETKNSKGMTLDEYIEKEIKIAEEYGVYVLDAYHNSGVNAGNIHEYTQDGLHPNGAGMELIGDMIADYLKGNVYESQ